MTVEQMVEEIYEALGEDSSLDPYDSSGNLDTSSDGYARILRWINRGYRRVLNWKFRDGHIIRFPVTYKSLNFKTVVHSGTLVSGSAGGVVLPSGTFQSADDYYNDWVIETESGTGSGATRYITDFTGSTRLCLVAEDFSTAPDSDTTFTIYKREYEFIKSGGAGVSDNIEISPVDSLLTPVKITDLEDEQDLSEADRVDNFSGSMTEGGTPNSWFLQGNKIIFDVPVDEVRWFRMEYVSDPDELSASTDEPDIPEVWHDAIILYVVWWGFRWLQQFTDAYATKRDLVDFMESTRQALEMRYERNLGVVEVLGPFS